jgi:hypothetical protein
MGWIFPIVLWSIIVLILRPKNTQDVNDYIFGIWVKEIKNVNAINVYHVCSRWFLIVSCLTSVWFEFFLKTFHSMRVPISLHSPSKNSKMQAYGTLANWMFTLFCPPWCIPNVHTKSLFKKKRLGGVLDMIGMGFWNPSHDWMEVGQILALRKFIILKTFIIEQNPKMQYLHNSFKINTMTWNSHCNIHIMI